MSFSTRTETSQEEESEHQKPSPRVPAAASLVAVAAILFLIGVWLDSRGGVFRSELTRESDEPAHYITALMVRDYIAQGMPAKPLVFAKNYYLHYPKVAFGHWPPVFYVLQAAWMLMFGVSRTSVLCMMLATTAALGATLYAVVSRALGSWLTGLAAAALLVCVPLVQLFSGVLMADMLVALLSFWAVLTWARYMESPSWRLAAAFALFSAATILTKGNGFALALVPPVAIVVCRRWDLMKRASLYGSAILILVASAPWSIITSGLVVPTWQYQLTPGFVATASWFLWSNLLRAPGVLVSAFGLVGVGAKIIGPFRSRRVESVWGAAFAQIIAVWVFHALVPAGLEQRYLLASLGPWLMFAAAGVQWVSERLSGRMLPARGWAVVLWVVAGVVFFATVFEIPQKHRLGFQEVAEELTSNPEFRNSVILCSSEGNGEGILISEVAMREARPGHILLRASRMLAESDWNGRNYKLKMKTPAEIQQFLEAAAVDVVVLDLKPGHGFEHHRQLLATVREPGWRRIGVYPRVIDSFTEPDTRIEIWRQSGVAKPAPTFIVEMNPTPRISIAAAPSR
jgi:hypothetical protein